MSWIVSADASFMTGYILLTASFWTATTSWKLAIIYNNALNLNNMDTKIAYTQTFLRKRKFLVVLPVLIIPFLTLAFWALGGGGVQTQGRTPAGPLGLNLQLPPAHIPNEAAGKLQFYEQ